MIAVIPARGGSKRIPHKNIKDFNGLPLIAYSIRTALATGLFSDVIVSTDDEEIAAVAKVHGASVPFLRDACLANDFTGTMPVAVDAYQKMSDLLQTKLAGVCMIYATAPLLTSDHLKAAFTKYLSSQADYLFAGCEFPFPIQRGFYLKEDGTPDPVMPECMPMRSQDLKKAYQDAGQFYIYSNKYLDFAIERNNMIMEGMDPKALPEHPANFVSRIYEMPRYRVIDIDTPEDWEYALILSQALKLSPHLK